MAQAVGRFAGWEPLGFEAGDENWYRFVANGPTAKTDPSGLYEPANTRPGTRPKGVPDGTRPIEMIPEMIRELIHKVKERLKRGGEGVGPKTWVGIDPDGNVWVPDFNGNGENLGGWQTWAESAAVAGIGALIMGWGAGIAATGCAGSAVIFADDITMIGVVDDPLLVVTGGVIVVGGAVTFVGGVVHYFGWEQYG